MKTTPIIGQRTLNPEKNAGISPDVVVAHKEKLITPGGKKEKLIVFSRVPQSQLKLDKSGKTQIAAKLAVKIMQERLEKRGLPPKQIDYLMSNMYVKADGKMEVDKRALDSNALDSFLDTGTLKSGKVRFADDEKQIPNKPVPSAPLPTQVNLPKLPDTD